MKKFLILFCGAVLLLSTKVQAQSGDNCANAAPFCTGTTYTFPNNTGVPSLGGNGAYGCLGSTPNPVWYFMQIANPGNLQITINQTSTGGSGIDVDFVCWGPFANQAAMCPGYSASNIVDCSYSTAATEVVDISSATTGQFYLLLMTNYSGTSGTLSFSQSGGAASTNCNVLCNMTALTANPGACNSGTGQYSVTGQVTVTYPPTTGTLTLTSSCGGSTTINPPFTSPISYTINGLTANGAACNVTASFSADATCTLTTAYTSPAACNPCIATATNNGPACPGGTVTLTATGGGTYSWSGPNGFTSTSATPSLTNITAADAGTYTITVTNGSVNCTATTSVVVNPVPTISSVAPVCSNSAAFNMSADIAGGTWTGTGITNGTSGTFTPSSGAAGTNVVTYTTASGCIDTVHVTVIQGSDPSWTAPASICVLDPAVDLTTYLTGTAGGTWSGTGVTGNMFDPAGLSGNVAITYTVGSSPCIGVSTQNIYINPNVPPVITSTTTVFCQNANAVTLTADIPGGVWVGPGITNSANGTFDPAMASTTMTDTIIYDISGSCRGADTLFITVNPAPSAAWTTATLCGNNPPINLDSLVTLASGTAGGTWAGSGVTGNMFDPAGLSGGIPVTYIVGTTCKDTLIQNITVIPIADPSWTTTSVCQVSSVLNLDNLVTGTTGGTWSGTGVTGSNFDPSGLSGNIAVTYTVGTPPCQSTSTQNINVVPMSDASWTTTSICADDSVDLNATVTGTTGGTWTGTGVTDSMFYGTGLSGLISVTYTVGPVGCQASTSHDITVTPVGNAAWTTTTLCSGASPINLDNLVTGTAGGTWSGAGVTGNTFDPAGLSGNVSVMYLVGTAPCQDSLTQFITIAPAVSSSWSPSPMCEADPPVNLDTYLAAGATTGGTWSGNGVTGNIFDPNGLNGFIAVTYTVGTAPCTSTTTQSISVIPNADATITAVAPVCESAAPFTFTGADPGGTWSSTGSGLNATTGLFNPFVASAGTYNVTYTIPGACGDANTISVTVLPTPSAAFSLPLIICETQDDIDLNSTIIGATGGTFSGNGVTNNSFDPSGLAGATPITYTVTQNGCSNSSTQFAAVDTVNADFSATPSSGLAPLEVMVFDSSYNALTYAWNFGNGNTSGSMNSSTIYSNMGDYAIELIVTNANGCKDTSRTIIHVEEISNLAMPNVFTPNGDDKNDTFRPWIREGITDFKAVVYDRWGKKVHEWNDVYEGWDGQTKGGKMCPDGVYYYIVSGKGVDGKSYEYTGFVQLLK